jgi:ribose transport system substrate-binding protein
MPHPLSRRIALLSLGLALLLLPGCLNEKKSDESPATGTGQTAAPAGGKKFKVGFAQANSQDPYRQVQNASLLAAAQKYPDIDFSMADAHQDSNAQIGQIDNFVTNRVDLLMVSPNEAAPLTPKVGEVYDKKIPVILMERGINSDKYTTLIGGNNVQIGTMAGDFLVKRLNGKGTYVEIKGIADATPTKDRSGGFHSVVDKATGIKLVDSYVCNYKRDEAIKYMENLLQKKTPFDAVYAHNDEMALGAMIAMKNAGIDPKGKVIIGIDGVQEESIRAILDGTMSATFKYPWLGEDAMQAAHDILTGKPVAKRITPDTEMVTKDNAQDYLNRLPKAK